MATIKRKSSAAPKTGITMVLSPTNTTAEHIVPAVSATAMPVLRSVLMHCTAGNSDKIYEIRLVDLSAGLVTTYMLAAVYGRRGSANLHMAHKGTYPTLTEALGAFAKLRDAKIAKNYVVISMTDNAASAAIATSSLGPRPPKLIAKTHSCAVHGHRLLLTSTGSSSSARTFVTCQYAGHSNGACSLRPYPLGELDVELTKNGKHPLIVGVVVRTSSEELEANSAVRVYDDKVRTETLILQYHDAKGSWRMAKNSLECKHDNLYLIETTAAHTRVKCQACHMTSPALPDATVTQRQGSASLFVVQTEAGYLNWMRAGAVPAPASYKILRGLKLVNDITPKTYTWHLTAAPAGDDVGQTSVIEPVVESVASDDALHACDHELLIQLENDTPYVRCLGACQSTWLIRIRPADPLGAMLLLIQGSYRKLVTRMALTFHEEIVTEQVGKTKIKDGTCWRCSNISVSACRKNNDKPLYEKHLAGLAANQPINMLLDILRNKMHAAIDDWREEQKTGGSLFGRGTGMIKRRK